MPDQVIYLKKWECTSKGTFFILLLKCLGLPFQRCKSEITSGMSLEGLAAEPCLVETLKEPQNATYFCFPNAANYPKVKI